MNERPIPDRAGGSASAPQWHDRERTPSVDLASTGRLLAERIAALAGVTAVLDAWTGFARWFGEPPVRLVQDDHRISASVTIGVDDRARISTTVAQVSEVLRSGLEEQGVGVGRLSVRVTPRG